MQCQRECSKNWECINHEIAAEVKGTILTSRQFSWEKNWSSLKSLESGRYRPNAVSEQQVSKSLNLGVKWTTANPETKNLPKKPCFLTKFSQKCRVKEFLRNLRVIWALKTCWGLLGDSGFFQLMRVVVSYRKEQKQKKKTILALKSPLAR